jgi:hypothetical protein
VTKDLFRRKLVQFLCRNKNASKYQHGSDILVFACFVTCKEKREEYGIYGF